MPSSPVMWRHKWIHKNKPNIWPELPDDLIEHPIEWSLISNELQHLIYDCESSKPYGYQHSLSIYKIPSISDKFIIDTWSESIDIYEYEKLYNHTEKFGVTKDNSIVVTMSNHILESMYDNVVIFNSSFYIMIEDYHSKIDFSHLPYTNEELGKLKTTKKPYRFLHLSGNPKTYRLYILDYLKRMGYLGKGLYSLLPLPENDIDWLRTAWTSPQSSAGKERKRYYELYDFDEEFFSKQHVLDYITDEFGGKVPNPNFDLFKETSEYKGGFQTIVQMDFIKNTYFNILNETVFDSNDGTSFMKNGAVTEKSIKSLCHQPTIVLSYPGTLRELKEMGFKTFSPWIDESYDDIKNDEDRLFMILDEIQRLCSIPEDELHDLYVECLNNVVYNQNVIINTTPKELINKFFNLIKTKTLEMEKS
jgi:hypothetical protein